MAAALAETPAEKASVVMVVGAGRGGLIRSVTGRVLSTHRLGCGIRPPFTHHQPPPQHKYKGPLVRASLQAATRAERRVRVYAVEKNPNAVVTLRNLGACVHMSQLVCGQGGGEKGRRLQIR